MMKLKLKLAVLVGSIAAIIGCEGWNTGSDALTWDDSYAFANFSGVYRGLNGNSIVFNFSASSALSTSNTTTSLENIEDEVLATSTDEDDITYGSVHGDVDSHA